MATLSQIILLICFGLVAAEDLLKIPEKELDLGWCECTTTSPCIIMWRKDGESTLSIGGELYVNDNYRLQTAGNPITRVKLIIKENVSLKNSTTFHCRIGNRIEFTVVANPARLPAQLTMKPNEEFPWETGKVYMLICRLIDIGYPIADIEWYKNDIRIGVKSSILQFKPLKMDDNNSTYYCMASNAYSEFLNVRLMSERQTIQIKKNSMKFMLIKRNNSTWSHLSDTGSFSFVSIDVTDTGYYYCRCLDNNGNSQDSDSRLLMIKAPPKVLETSKSVRRQGNNFQLYFTYTGISLVTSVVWKLGDSTIDKDRYQIKSYNMTGQYEYGQTMARRSELNWIVNCPYDVSYNGFYQGLIQTSNATYTQVLKIQWFIPDDLCAESITPSTDSTTSNSDGQIGEKILNSENSSTTVIVTSVCVVFFVALAGFFVIIFSWKKWQLKKLQYNESSSNGDASNCNTVCTTCSGEDSENNSVTNVRLIRKNSLQRGTSLTSTSSRALPPVPRSRINSSSSSKSAFTPVCHLHAPLPNPIYGISGRCSSCGQYRLRSDVSESASSQYDVINDTLPTTSDTAIYQTLQHSRVNNNQPATLDDVYMSMTNNFSQQPLETPINAFYSKILRRSPEVGAIVKIPRESFV
ncbi:DgyrCDS6561 [Dimorphilus gyrociliatus]|uniref:DgyrCDS6561 n=1 Tax=Dimorphilus gyrociliatus TaxID=2664684 RepID=A0A7I8VNE7_9ANNE|nr:DgyrCDS6561 [Dimorphilus gyrociliatus]